jgi:hypothetical protein
MFRPPPLLLSFLGILGKSKSSSVCATERETVTTVQKVRLVPPELFRAILSAILALSFLAGVARAADSRSIALPTLTGPFPVDAATQAWIGAWRIKIWSRSYDEHG